MYLAPNDAHHMKPGKWTREGQTVHVFDETGGLVSAFTILEQTPDLLRTRKL